MSSRATRPSVKGWDIADTFPGGGGNWGGSFLTVPTQSKNPQEAKALAAWLTAPEQQIKAFKAKGTFPSQTAGAREDPELTSVQEHLLQQRARSGKSSPNRAKAVHRRPVQGAEVLGHQRRDAARHLAGGHRQDGYPAQPRGTKFVTAVKALG
ncbi:MAG: extracellular solute-binding protein [Dermatophilaceae bacterium]